MENCIFCKIVKKEIPAEIVYEDSKFSVFLDISPASKGHCLVVPKEHHKDIFDIPDSMLKEMSLMIKKTANTVKNALKADGINIIFNNGRSAGQLVFHIHAHVIPRYEKDNALVYTVNKPHVSNEQMQEIKLKILSSF